MLCRTVWQYTHSIQYYSLQACCKASHTDVLLLLYACALTACTQIAEIWSADLNPTFRECWYDHILMDLLGANLLGILAARAVIKRRGRRYYYFRLQACLYIISSRCMIALELWSSKPSAADWRVSCPLLQHSVGAHRSTYAVALQNGMLRALTSQQHLEIPDCIIAVTLL
jgi:Phosphatidyl serine synthase